MGRGSALLQVALLDFLIFPIFTRLSSASQYTVGDSSKWNLNVDYSTWAAKYSFEVGDSLLFSYNAEEHDVYQVSQADYGSCSNLNPIKTYDDGNTVVALVEATTYYFMCGIPGHCGQGMNVAIKVGASTPPAKTPTSTPPPTSTTPPTKTPSIAPPTSTPTSPPIPTPSVPPSSASSPTHSSSPTLSPTPTPFISPTPSPSSSSPPSLAPSTPSTIAVLPPSSTPPSPTSSSLPSPKVVVSFTVLLGALLLLILL